jgi:exopolysaccharide biosynthesis polyprenyl glycosylphosphotransferase
MKTRHAHPSRVVKEPAVVSVPAEITRAEPPTLGRRLFAGAGWLRLRIVSDVVLLLMGIGAALLGAPAEHQSLPGGWLVWAFPPLVLLFMAMSGMYRDTIQVRVAEGVTRILAATSLASVTLIAGAALIDPASEPAPLLARAWVFGTLYLVVGRLLLARGRRRARATRLVAKPTLIVGAGQIGARVERRLSRQPELGLLPVGYLDSDPPPPEMVPDREAPVLGDPSDLRRIARETGAEHLVLGFSTAPDRLLLPLVRESESLGLEVSLVPRLFESVNVRVALDHLGGLPLFGLRTIDPKGWQFTVKYALDRLVAGVLIAVLAPVLAACALAVRLSSPGPVLYRQRRIGVDGREFEMLKFRSMRVEGEPRHDASGDALTLPVDTGPGGVEGLDRRTRVGIVLRQTSLDELPQLFNVARGEMSLVGPRPERPEFVDLFGERIERYGDRHRVKSGVTGWAQVHGLRGKTSLRDRIEWDNYYIENWSLWLDFKILLRTVLVVFNRSE